ncbi:hypothetical protein F2Q69_00013834 [Brassica cretica]|uniref:Uncharacterized protein n=1 Tax=Brassica cretica TaxID=69181 RepID=A0A8S9R0H5_BRACR|nr:hypothetical protein F2Q69_00013834 [Brassica cretica]
MERATSSSDSPNDEWSGLCPACHMASRTVWGELDIVRVQLAIWRAELPTSSSPYYERDCPCPACHMASGTVII